MTIDEEDKELYKKYLNGQKEAFEKIVVKNKDRLIYFISKYTNNIYPFSNEYVLKADSNDIFPIPFKTGAT